MTGPEATDQAAGHEGISVGDVSRWFSAHILGATVPLGFRLVAGGRSNLTYAVDDAAGHTFVLRRPPTGHLLPTAHDMAREHRIIAAVGPAGVPVPTALGLCLDPEVTGAPFYVMDFVDGHILRDQAQAEAAFPPAARREVSASLVDTLAAIHALDPDDVGLGDLGRREGYVARQLRRWYAQYQASRDDGHAPSVDDIDTVHDDLNAAIPAQGPATIVHGDYRLDNTVVGPDRSIVAVLDWELCTLGDPLADVGQLLAYWTEPGEASSLGQSPTTAEGFMSRAQVAARYAAASGRDVDGIDYYVAFATWKLACILSGVYARYLAGAMGDPGFDYSFYPDAITGLASRSRAALDATA